MVFNNFRLRSILRDLLIAAAAILAFFLLARPGCRLLAVFPAAAAVFLVVNHIRYIEKINRDVTRFFENIQYSDFSLTFSDGSKKDAFDGLRTEMNRVLDRFREARTGKEEHYRFLQTVVQHVGIALVAFRRDGEVILINNPAIRLFRVAQVAAIDDLKPFSTQLVETMKRLKFGERELVTVKSEHEVMQLSVYATEFILKEQNVTLVSIQDIRSELEEKEMEAWQKLIRVLTHEIMNSISPIVSYASSINDLLANRSTDGDSGELLNDIQSAMQVIHSRSQGLLHFVDNYRNLTVIPKPSFQAYGISRLVHDVVSLMRNELHSKGITCTVTVDPESLKATIDPKLIEQVLINLMVNAIHALDGRGNPAISIEAGLEKRGKVYIKVTDNGSGIEESVLEKVFIPFFTTKPKGSGIGLSLSRQIVRQHGGSISVFSKVNEYTTLILQL